mgnify:FL=1
MRHKNFKEFCGGLEQVKKLVGRLCMALTVNTNK